MSHNLSLLVVNAVGCVLPHWGVLPHLPLQVSGYGRETQTRWLVCVFISNLVKNCERSRKASRHETIHDETETFCPRPGPSRLRPETPNFGFKTESLSRDLTSLNIMVVNSRISIEHFKKRGYLDLVTVHCVQYWTLGTGNDLNPITPSFHFTFEKST